MATTTITVSAQDVVDADAYLAQYLKDNIPDGDFSVGSSTRDFCVGAIARIFAFFRKEVTTVKDSGTLLRLSNLENQTDRDEAANAILANLLVTRNPGRRTHIPVVLHFSQATDVSIVASTRFFKTSSLVFYIDQVDTFVASAAQLTPTVASDGSIVDYVLTVACVAAEIGTDYNVGIGRFLSADPFNPYFTYAENTSTGTDGLAVQSTDEMIANAPNALTVRDLVNERAITTVVKEAFSDITRVVVKGMGDPEMVRDLSTEAVTGLRMHTGGAFDVYVNLPVGTVTEELTVGALFVRPDNAIVELRDTPGTFTGVTAGMVLRVVSGLVDSPRNYLIASNDGYDSIQVNARTPFATATDEASPTTQVTYQIGEFSPTFDDVLTVQTTGYTSRRQAKTHAVTLAGQPHMRITSVELVDNPNPVVVMGPRVNTAPTGHEYQVITENPGEAQSGIAVTRVYLPALVDGVSPDGKTLRITYETLVDHATLEAYLAARTRRTLSASVLGRGFHPVYCAGSLTYDLSKTATSVPDESEMSTAVANFVNSYPTTDILSVQAVQDFITTAYPSVVRVYPFNLTYTLVAPDGQLYEFSTTDLVQLHPDADHSAMLTNGLALRVPIQNADLARIPANAAAIAQASLHVETQLLAMGVTDDVVRYLATAGDFVCVRKG